MWINLLMKIVPNSSCMLDKKHEEQLFQETISIFVRRFSKLSGAADMKSESSETDHTLMVWFCTLALLIPE